MTVNELKRMRVNSDDVLRYDLVLCKLLNCLVCCECCGHILENNFLCTGCRRQWCLVEDNAKSNKDDA